MYMEPKAYFAKAIYYKEIFILSRTYSTISSDTASNKVSGFYTFCEQICTFGVIDDDFQINKKNRNLYAETRSIRTYHKQRDGKRHKQNTCLTCAKI